MRCSATVSLKYCPGAKSLVEPQIITSYCPVCGAEVEFFEYELERKCPDCGRTVKREASPSCIMWCKSAAECLANLKALGAISPERAEELEKIMREKRSKE
ncbi:MAG: NADH pyrophosphatase zinc ribbon domain-containing protein [Candidatus Nezhaarchaeota archaeon]|nr:NADH pyrophosphatase zinc ribbon domain-containing protein [Candidatus Nezhaarchaeota archaeon]